jgi:PAS domain S-box-containing protein
VVFRNITERRRIENALRESEEQLRDVLELSLDAVYRTDLVAGRFDYISPINEALTGFSAEEFGAFGLDEFLDRIHVEDQPRVKMVVAEAMRGGRTGTSGTIEYRFRHRDGSWRWLSDHFGLQADGEGRPRYRVGVVRDVTRRRRIESALWESEERLRLAQEGARIGIWDWEAATNRVTISPDFLAIYGLEALAISCYADLERMIHPEDRMQVWNAQLAVLGSGARMDLELRIVLPPGEIRWVQFKGQAIMDEQGALARVIGVLIDVTERKRAEEALHESEADARSFFENMVDACAICEMVVDERGEPADIRLVDVNPAFERTLGLPARLIVGQTAFMILPTLHREWLDLFVEVGREGGFVEVEEPFPALDRRFHVTGFPVRDGRVAVVFRDVTGI